MFTFRLRLLHRRGLAALSGLAMAAIAYWLANAGSGLLLGSAARASRPARRPCSGQTTEPPTTCGPSPRVRRTDSIAATATPRSCPDPVTTTEWLRKALIT